MSALPPKADVAPRERHVRFVPKADSWCNKKLVNFSGAPLGERGPRALLGHRNLLDHPIGERKQFRRKFAPDRLCCFEVKYKFEIRWLFDRQISWLCTFEHLVDKDRRGPEHLLIVRTLRHETARFHVGAAFEHGGYSVPVGKIKNAVEIASRERFSRH